MRRNKGITLVALVVTIIILLILAGISIATLTDNGLFKNSKIAKEKYENSQLLEDDILSSYEKHITESFRANVEGFGISKLISDVNLEILEVSTSYVKLRVTTNNDENVRGYGILINKELVKVSENNEILVPNLIDNTDYIVVAYILDKNNNVKFSDEKQFKTLERLYLYKEGNEFETLTGGWSVIHNSGASLTKDTNKFLWVTNGSSTYEKSIIQMNNPIDLSKYSKIGITTSINTQTLSGSAASPYVVLCGHENKQTTWQDSGIISGISTQINNSVGLKNFSTVSEIPENAKKTLYLHFRFGTSGNVTKCQAEVTEVWLEK